MLKLEVRSGAEWLCVNRVSLPLFHPHEWYLERVRMLSVYRDQWEASGYFGADPMRIARYSRRGEFRMVL